DVFGQLLFRLLEENEHAWLAELRRTPHQKLHGQERLAASRSPAHQRGAPAGQPAPGDLVQTLNARRGLQYAYRSCSRLGVLPCHAIFLTSLAEVAELGACRPADEDENLTPSMIHSRVYSLVSRSALPTYADSTRAFVGRQRRGFRLLDLVPAVGEVLERVEGKTAGIEGNGSCSVLL